MKRLFKSIVAMFIILWIGTGNALADVQLKTSMPAESMIRRLERLNELGKKNDQKVSYNAHELNGKSAPAIETETNNMEEWLYKSLINSGFTYEKRENNHYLVLRSAEGKINEVGESQQQSVVTGRVTDINDEPLIGVNIVEKGTTNGTVTDIDGRFTLSTSPNATLVFSYIGYESIEVPRNGRSSVEVVLREDTELLDEVVVVGYGTQKVINLTGAVGVITSEDIVKRPITNVSTGLQGLVPGMTVIGSANGGLPGQSNASIQIRGIGSRSNNNPLVLIDGAEGDMNIINPNDIESITVLKDAASAAIYGNRAANGVILITTKSVTGKDRAPRINIDTYMGSQRPTKLPKMADSPTFMRWENEAQENVGGIPNYTEEDIQTAIDGTDPNYFANTDWIAATILNSAPQYSLNASIDGKASNMGYLLSYGFLDQDGLTVGQSTNATRHNVRMKLNTQVADRFDVTANMSYIDRKYKAPNNGFGATSGSLYNAMRTRPLVPVRFTDGKWGYGGGQSNQVAYLTDGGGQEFSSQEFTGNFSVKVDLLKGWTASANYITRQSNSFRNVLSKTINFYYPDTNTIWYATNTPNSIENRDYRALNQNLFAQTDYETKWGNHFFKAMVGYQQEWQRSDYFSASRKNLITEKDPVLDFGSPDTQANNASASHWAMRSGFGRINYNYDERYLFEANLRYDLTSRFIKQNRGEWFPSFSAGWRLSEEEFMAPTRDIIDQLKIRASWGILGNQFSTGSDNYPYLSRIGVVTVPAIGTVSNDGYAETYIGNPNLLWEMVHTSNIGIDLNMLNNRLTFNGDYFLRETRRMIYQRELPGAGGFPSAMDENGGRMENKGWEMQLGWRDRVNDFNYRITATLADVKNKITEWEGEIIGSTTITKTGYSNNAFYGLIADGIAMPTDFEKFNPYTGKYENPKFPILSGDAGLVQPGDIKYKDLDNSGSIDLDNDRAVLGSSIPRYTYSFKGDLEYKGIDFSMLLQGVGKIDGYVYGPARHAFTDQSTYPQLFHEGRYQASNPNPNASYPRFTYNQSYNQRFSTFWMEDASYLRLKNVQIGYTIPQKFTRSLRIDRCRIYASADNLFTFTNYFETADPENPVQAGGNYPQIKTYVFGINITLH
ncbi:MAG: hypothetical protein XD92_0256 [Proteiniphilum acetatigenes]|uniref:SusC/RagA family TonB-linked outer membrane protein n=1 Tax=Proteiniphilum acetatigenes TaxID=294710 RepID=A0A101HKK4_9BACT|nr:MAG: hypothetical protein XD92_0256 [Proteiniphilum acetatigenes]